MEKRHFKNEITKITQFRWVNIKRRSCLRPLGCKPGPLCRAHTPAHAGTDSQKRPPKRPPAVREGLAGPLRGPWILERAKGTAPGHQLVYYEHFFRSRRHGMDSIVDSSLRPGQRRPLRVIQSEPSTSINSQSIGFHSEVYASTGTPRHRPQRTGELRPQRTGLSSTGEASSFTRARNRFMGSEGSPRRRSR